MAMARNCYVFAFLTIWSLLCVSALEEGGTSLAMEEATVVGDEQILRLPSEDDSRNQAIPWEQSPFQIHSLRFPRRPMVGEEKEMEMEHLPNFGAGRLRPVRFRFGRPGGCHGKFRHSLMPTEDPSQPQFLRRMGMGHHRHANDHAHAHAHPYLFPAIEDHEETAYHGHLKPEREGMGFEMQRGREFEGGFGGREEEEHEGPWMAWLRSRFH